MEYRAYLLGLTLESHLNAAFLYAAKLFDSHRDSLNLGKVLRVAEHKKDQLTSEALAELSQASKAPVFDKRDPHPSRQPHRTPRPVLAVLGYQTSRDVGCSRVF